MRSIGAADQRPQSRSGGARQQQLQRSVVECALDKFRVCWDQVLDGCEVCAGTAMLTRVLQLHGINIRALDITYWNHSKSSRPALHNPLDMLGNAGFVSLIRIRSFYA